MIALVGLMGSGKTTVGALVAERLGWALVDSDRELEAALGHTAKDVVAGEGAGALHEQEAAIAREHLCRGGEVVLTTAASVVDLPALRDLLRQRAFVVWLHAEPDVLGARAAGGAHRPLLGGDAVGALRQMAGRRNEHFAEVADLALDVTSAPPEELAAAIISALA